MSDRSGRPGGRTYDERLWPTGTTDGYIESLHAEIERLQKWLDEWDIYSEVMERDLANAKKDVENLEGSLKNVRYAVIEDMREWFNANGFLDKCPHCGGVFNKSGARSLEMLNAYAKDRGIE